MDTTAEEIIFDDDGVCSFCHYFDEHIESIIELSNSEDARKLLNEEVASIKNRGRNKQFDAILGLSGGIDSSYLAYMSSQLGLRLLFVHVDTGWNTPESEANVGNIVEKLGLELHVFNIDWDEMRDLQTSFYKASVKNCEIPQDHAFLAALYGVAEKYRVSYILTGGNAASESILPVSWGYNAADLHHLLAIQRRYGTVKLHQFPTMSFWQRYGYYPFLKGIKERHLLDRMPYNRAEAKRTLAKEFGWLDYGAMHYESVLTRFFQGHYLPAKFGIDKRKAHLSSLILSGQITKEEALNELKKPPYPSEEQLQADKTYIAQKLGLSLYEWEEILALPPRAHDKLPSSRLLFGAKDRLVELLGIRKKR